MDALTLALKLPASFWDKVMINELTGCWVWCGARQGGGYGTYKPPRVRGKPNETTKLVHRYAYSILVGPIRSGYQIDHLCKNRACVNPAHLEPVTPTENVRRSSAPKAARDRHAKITHCPRGHEYTPENTKIRTGRGWTERECRECRRHEGRLYMRAKRAARRADQTVPKVEEPKAQKESA